MKTKPFKHSTAVIIAAFLITLTALFFINKDIFHYEFLYSKPVTYTPEEYTKADYLLTEGFVLKPGTYVFSFLGQMLGKKSSVYLVDQNREKLISVEFIDGETEYSEEFRVNQIKTVQLGVSYDPEFGSLEINRISLSSDHVIYKESIIRHFILSIFVVILVICCLWLIQREKINYSILYIILLTAIICLPYFSKDYFWGDDLFFHLSRIEGMAQTIKAGYFPARNQLFWLQDYGYGVGFFYPDLFLYIPAVVRCLGFSLLFSYKFFIILTTFCSLSAFYYVGKRIGQTEICGVMTALIAAFSVFRLIDMYGRAAVGEIQAFVFGPFVILGLFEIYNGHPEKWYFFALGFWGLCNCHLISLSMAVVLTAVYILINIRKTLQHKQILLSLIKATVTVVCLLICFFLPMLEQLRPGKLVINILTSSKTGGISEKLMVPLQHLVYFFHTWRDPTFQSNNAYPGLIFLLIPFLRLLQIKKRSRALHCADILTIFGAVLIFASTSLFPWKYFQWFLNRIQYAWRLFLPLSVIFPVSGGIYITGLGKGKKSRHIIYGVFGLLTIVCGFPVVYETMSSRMVPQDRFWMQNNRVSGGEYKPIGLSIEYIDKNRDTVKTDPANVPIVYHDRKGLTFTFSWAAAENEIVDFEVPLIDYVGYRAELTTEDGKTKSIPVRRADNGLVLVNNDGQAYGSIHVHFEKTVIQKAADGFSVISYLVLFFIMSKRRLAAKSRPVSK